MQKKLSLLVKGLKTKRKGVISVDDKSIIALFFFRDEKAITESDNKYGHYCRTISFNVLNDRQDADECTNDTYLQAWNTIPPTKPESLKAYLGKIVRNISLNKLKAKQTQKRKSDEFSAAYDELENVLTSNQTIDEHIDEIHLRELIEKFLDKQTKENRKIFIARYWYFESVREISTKLGITESKTKMSLMRMRNSLRSFLEQEGVVV